MNIFHINNLGINFFCRLCGFYCSIMRILWSPIYPALNPSIKPLYLRLNHLLNEKSAHYKVRWCIWTVSIALNIIVVIIVIHIHHHSVSASALPSLPIIYVHHRHHNFHTMNIIYDRWWCRTGSQGSQYDVFWHRTW